MNNNKYLHIIALSVAFLFVATIGTAQVNPPNLLCVQNDSLFWELPTNNCGTFNSYDVYVSNSINGPYTLLASVTDPMQINFSDPNPMGELRFYFLQSNFNCPGIPVINSDTLDNQSPELSPITSVSVINGQVLINWAASASPEVVNYVVFRTTPSGTLPIDTVDATNTSYIDLGADPISQIESYYIIAMDACGNTSIFDVPHFTMFLETQVNACEQSILLTWNRYQNWQNGIGTQEVWYSEDNGAPQLLESISPSDSTYLFTATDDGADYCFYIQASEAGTGFTSRSNEACLTLNVVEPVRDLVLTNVSVIGNNLVEVSWYWNNDAEVTNIQAFQSNQNSAYELNDAFPPLYPLSTINQVNLAGLGVEESKQYFRFTTVDACDSTKESNYASTIHLLGEAQPGLSNFLSWTAFDIPGGTIQSYDIYRIVEGIESYVETVDASTLNSSDPVDVENAAEANVCYYIVAHALIDLPNGNQLSIESRSNIACVEQLTSIIAPNAFAPSGINKEFKPVIVFGEEVDYILQIYDRWGQQLFESRNIATGWTGKKNQFEYPMGAYTYLIRVVQPNGRIVEKSGTLVLLR